MPTVYDKAKDPYASQGSGPDTFGSNSNAISTSDAVDFTSYPKAIVVTAGGDLKVLPLKAADDGNHIITFSAASAGLIVPFRVRRVLTTGTTASSATIED